MSPLVGVTVGSLDGRDLFGAFGGNHEDGAHLAVTGPWNNFG